MREILAYFLCSMQAAGAPIAFAPDRKQVGCESHALSQWRNEKRPERGVFVRHLAEQEGFEPSIRYNRIPDFESGAFDHSAIAPVSEALILTQGRRVAGAPAGAVPVGLMVMDASTWLKMPPSSSSTVAERSARVNTSKLRLPRTAATKVQP